MSENIIDFRKAKLERMKPDASYFVRVDLYPGGLNGEILDLGDDIDADGMRFVSNNLFALARHFRDLAWEKSQDPSDRMLNVMRVFGDSSVSTWTSNDVATAEQVAWLEKRYAESFETIKPLDAERK